MTRTAYVGIFALLLTMVLVAMLVHDRKPEPEVRANTATPAAQPSSSDRADQIRQRQLAEQERHRRERLAEQQRQRDAQREAGRRDTTEGPRRETPVASSGFTSYTVKPNERLWDIAREKLGSGSKWRQIAEDNPGTVTVVNGDTAIVRAGAVLKIRARQAATGSTRPSAPARTGATAAVAPTPTSGKRYTVKDGDRLWWIAKNLYGDGNKWTKIRDANASVINGTGTLIEGMVIFIP